MDDGLTEEHAYAMARAYTKANNRENAIVVALHEMQEADTVMLKAMWGAIDAYVDLNT